MIELPEAYVIIPYARVGTPGAELCEVWDLAVVPPVRVPHVYEANAQSGWYVRFVCNEAGKPVTVCDAPVLERCEGVRIEIRKYLHA